MRRTAEANSIVASHSEYINIFRIPSIFLIPLDEGISNPERTNVAVQQSSPLVQF